jgi:hypothetical protein
MLPPLSVILQYPEESLRVAVVESAKKPCLAAMTLLFALS